MIACTISSSSQVLEEDVEIPVSDSEKSGDAEFSYPDSLPVELSCLFGLMRGVAEVCWVVDFKLFVMSLVAQHNRSGKSSPSV